MTHPTREARTTTLTPLPRVAVIVAAYDAEAYLADTLESVSAQTYREWECIVVDDGSTDSTAEIADGFSRRDPRFRLVRQANAGVSAARNAGLEVVADDVTLLAFLDSDDTWVPDALAVLVASLDDDALLGVYGTAEYMDAGGVPMRPGAHAAVQSDRRALGRFDLVDVPRDELTTWSSLIVSGTIWPPAVALHRREAVERAGRFDPEQQVVEDWDLYLRMSRQGAFRPLDRQVAWYRQHDTNLTKRTETIAFFDARVRWKAWRSPANTGAQSREAQRIWRRLQLRWIYWSVGALSAGLRAADVRRSHEAAEAVALFTRQLLAGHPAEPDARMARAVSRFVTPRAAGRGSPDA